MRHSGSRELLEQYWALIGGKPTTGTEMEKKGRGKGLPRPTNSTKGLSPRTKPHKRSKAGFKDEDSESPAPKKQKRGRKSLIESPYGDTPEFVGYVEQGEDDWKPPPPRERAWEPLLQKVDTIEETDTGERWAYLCWNDKNSDGRFYRSKAKLPTVYKAAPQKMLFFYEQHL